jgi:hypothetical protein
MEVYLLKMVVELLKNGLINIKTYNRIKEDFE